MINEASALDRKTLRDLFTSGKREIKAEVNGDRHFTILIQKNPSAPNQFQVHLSTFGKKQRVLGSESGSKTLEDVVSLINSIYGPRGAHVKLGE